MKLTAPCEWARKTKRRLGVAMAKHGSVAADTEHELEASLPTNDGRRTPIHRP